MISEQSKSDVVDSNKDSEYNQSNELDARDQQYPQRIVQYITLMMEISLALGYGLLLTWVCFLIKTIVQIAIRDSNKSTDYKDSIAAIIFTWCIELLFFLYGTLWFMTWFFGQTKYSIIYNIGVFKLPTKSIALVVSAVLFHLGISMAYSSTFRQFSTLRDQLYEPKTLQKLINSVIIAPIREEMYFRGLIYHIILKKLQTPKCMPFTSASAISSFVFSIIHLMNISKVKDATITLYYFIFQLWAALFVGYFYALRISMSNSLLECILLHSINNLFAQFVDWEKWIKFNDTDITQIAIITNMVYGIVIFYCHQTLKSQDKTLVKLYKHS